MAQSCLDMTIEETVSYLQRSFIPTILVEGSSDKAALRNLEREIDIDKLDILPVCGKGRLHDVYCRRSEFRGKSIVFLRDRDEYVACVPGEELSDYVFTSGHSIENDVLDKSVIENLSGDRFPEITRRVELVADWFRHVLQIYIGGEAIDISMDVSLVLNGSGYSVKAIEQIAAVQLESPCLELRLEDAWRWLRGKTLLRTIHSVFCEMDVKYSKSQLLHCCICFGPSPDFISLVERIRVAFLSLGETRGLEHNFN